MRDRPNYQGMPAHVYDHGAAAFYRQQDQERAERETAERAARWIAGKLAGHRFDSLAALERSVIDLVTVMQDGEPDASMAATIHRASVMLWTGEINRDSLYRLCVIRDAGLGTATIAITIQA